MTVRSDFTFISTFSSKITFPLRYWSAREAAASAFFLSPLAMSFTRPDTSPIFFMKLFHSSFNSISFGVCIAGLDKMFLRLMVSKMFLSHVDNVVIPDKLFTPLGFVHLFGVVGGVLVKPQFLQDLDEVYYVCSVEEQTLKRRINTNVASGRSYISPEPMYPDKGDVSSSSLDSPKKEANYGTPLLQLQNGELQSGLKEHLKKITAKKKVGFCEIGLDEVGGKRKTSPLQRNVVYPLAMLALLALTAITVLVVIQNTLELLIGVKALPLSTRQFTLGIASLSKLGWAGATLQTLLILYLYVASVTGLSAGVRALGVMPRARRTPLPRIIALCAVSLTHSTAQPLLAKILGNQQIRRDAIGFHGVLKEPMPCRGRRLGAVRLADAGQLPQRARGAGITNFDLLGEFGRIEWLGNFKLVMFYNAVFAAIATLCLVSKFTASVRRELYNRLVENVNTVAHCVSFLNN
ncbi:hypothetical protein MSG28_002698 [Choristoneura fumiferana]|uniref:Uncharacterized protein n=1 Tax=Choristoneura fumiferana TaxID=7141 RepID=A0ACC0JJS9_CHOFU|nr:hypothetical protein MSG28_002698 [Choristoneura fumiferana]